MQVAKRILILCTANSARSQMAEGLLKHICQNRYKISSGGSFPTMVRAEAITVLAEIGIDISGNRSKSVEEFAGESIDVVLTVCDNAQQNCPHFPAKTRMVHRSFADPAAIDGSKEETLNAFRAVRDQIEEYLKQSFLPAIESEFLDSV